MTRYLDALRTAVSGARLGRATTQVPRLLPLDLTPVAAELDALDPARATAVAGLLDRLDVDALGAAMDAGEVTAVELALVCLGRVRDHDERLRSLVEVNPSVLDEARAADARRAAGTPASPLDGIPVTVKDNVETAPPLRTTVGAAALLEHRAAADAPLVVALRRAGAVLLGTGNLSELAGALSARVGFSSVAGQAVNPHGDAFSPGGSSAGAGVAVSAGLAVLSIGTETAGSLVVPGSFDGVVAFKPSWGVVPHAGVAPLVGSQDCPGPVARTVTDAARLLAVVADPPVVAGLDPEALRGVRVGVLRDDVLAARTPFEDTSDTPAVLGRVVEALREAGAEPVDVRLADHDPAAKGLEGRLLGVVLGGLRWETGEYVAGATGGTVGGRPLRSLDDLVRFNLADAPRRAATGQRYGALALVRRPSREAHLAAAEALRDDSARVLAATAEGARVDVLLSLSNVHSGVYAPSGVPVVTVPAGRRTSGMPVGATLVAVRRGDDARLLGWAHALEHRLGPRPVPVGGPATTTPAV